MIYTVTFNPSVDCILHIGDVKFGGLNRASKEEFFFSGKGINVSTVLHRLGAATSAITFVGGFTGSETERVLSPDVPLDVIRLAEGCTRINVKLKAPDGSETEINAPARRSARMGCGSCTLGFRCSGAGIRSCFRAAFLQMSERTCIRRYSRRLRDAA